MPLADLIARLSRITYIESVLEVAYEKSDGVMNGDASLKLSDNSLGLRMYYRGFLAGEVTEKDGVVKSNPKLSRAKTAILVDGLRHSFMWWNIKDFRLEERDTTYILKNSYRKIVIDRKTLLPLQQTIATEDDDIVISYDEPAAMDVDSEAGDGAISGWYQAHMRISFRKNAVNVRVKSYNAYTKKPST